MPSKIKKGRPEKIRRLKSFPTFLIEEYFFIFGFFLYDLEISDSFKNGTPNVLIRLQKVRFIFFRVFFQWILGSPRIPKVGW